MMNPRCRGWATVTNHREQFHLCYVLHRRDYRNTSLLVELFSQELGRVPAIAKGAKSSRSNLSGMLQPFRLISVKLAGRGEIKTLTSVENTGRDPGLGGKHLYCGFYVNELMMRLLEPHDAHQQLFSIYTETLHRLASGEDIELSLRQFELLLLQELGYGLVLTEDVETGLEVDPDAHYRYEPDAGPVRVNDRVPSEHVYQGLSLLELERGTFSCETTRKEARRFMRLILSRYLGEKPLKSRELFRSVQTD